MLKLNQTKTEIEGILKDLKNIGDSISVNLTDVSLFRQYLSLEGKKQKRRYSCKKTKTGGERTYIVKFEGVQKQEALPVDFEFKERKIIFENKIYIDVKKINDCLQVGEYCDYEPSDINEFLKLLNLVAKNKTPQRKFVTNVENFNGDYITIRRIS